MDDLFVPASFRAYRLVDGFGSQSKGENDVFSKPIGHIKLQNLERHEKRERVRQFSGYGASWTAVSGRPTMVKIVTQC